MNSQHSSSLPTAFEKRMKETLGAEYNSFSEALQKPSTVSVRLNPRKRPSVTGEKIPWCESGLYLASRPVFALDPEWHAGAYYVQEASSMMVELALKNSVDLSEPLRVLDLCAAPGGKSTHLLSLLNRDSLLVSNEVIKSRAGILQENLIKWGHINSVTTVNDARDFSSLTGFFDVIVVDAPCSGEGLFRKEPESMSEWSQENVNLCSARQKRILAEVFPALKEGGVLIYSTCTYNSDENELNMQWIQQQQQLEFTSIDKVPSGVEEIRNGKVIGYRLMPHRVNGEGFFISIIRKLDKTDRIHVRRSSLKKSLQKLPGKWINRDVSLIDHNGLLIAVPERWWDEIDFLSRSLTVSSRGTALAEVKNNKFIPEHALAMSIDLAASDFSVIDLNLDDALRFLRKDNLTIADNERGFALVRYNSNPLGWINRLGNRVNNLYPQNWRIRMQSSPSH